MGGTAGRAACRGCASRHGSQIAILCRSPPATPLTRGCGTLRRCHASRYLRGATPVAATPRLRFAEPDRLRAPAGTRDTRRPHNTTSPDASPGDGHQAGLTCGHPMGAGPGSAARRRSELAPNGHRSGSTPAPRRAAPPPSVAAAVRWSHGSGMPSHLDIERAKHTHRSQPTQRRTTASSPPCENLTAATTKLLCGVAAANISSGRQRRAGGHSYATWLNASAILLPSRGM